MSSHRSRAALFQIAVRLPGQPVAVLPLAVYPFAVGRAAGASCRLDAPGVWDRHLHFELDPSEGLQMVAGDGALVRHQGSLVTRHRVRNGDEFEAGPAVIRVMMGPPARRRLGFWELLLWLVLGVMAAVQFAVGWNLLID